MKCSKCGFENPKNAKYCLNCGHKLDVEVTVKEDNESENGFNAKRKKADEIFNKISLILSLVIFAVSLAIVFSKFLTIKGSNNVLFGTAYQYLVANWFDFNEVDILEKTSRSAAFIFVLNNIIATYVFGIMGLVRCIKALKNKERFTAHKYLCIVFVSNILMLALLKAINGTVYYNGEAYVRYETFEAYESYLVICLISFVAMYIFQAFLEFDKNKVSLFVKRIFMSFGFFLALILINNIGSTYLGVDGGNEHSVIQVSLFLLARFFDGSATTNENIITMIFATGLLVFQVMSVILTCSLAIYLTNGYFDNRNNKKSFLIPCYIVGFAIAVLSVINLVLGLVLGFMLKSNEPAYYFGTYLNVDFAMSLLLFGSLLASLYILKAYLRNKKN